MKLPPAPKWVTAFFLTSCLSILPRLLGPIRTSFWPSSLQACCCLWHSAGMEKILKEELSWEVNSLQKISFWGTPCSIGVGQVLQNFCKLCICINCERWKLFHLSCNRTRQHDFSPITLWHDLSMDMFGAAIICSVRLFQHTPCRAFCNRNLFSC